MTSLNFERIKSNRPFKIGDLVLYFFILVFVAALFFVFVLLPTSTSKDADGFKIILKGNEVFLFNYSTCEYEIFADYNDYVTVIDEGNGAYKIKIYTDSEKTEFNLLTVNATEKTVGMSDSNCSESKDCVHMPYVTDEDDFILCAPHKLKILPSNSGYKPPTSGER